MLLRGCAFLAAMLSITNLGDALAKRPKTQYRITKKQPGVTWLNQ